MKTLISVGNSFAHGFIANGQSKVESYVEKFNKYLGYNVLNLAQSGASNYHIAKQIEYIFSENLNPDLVIICTGPTHRIADAHLTSSVILRERPTIRNFRSGKNENPPYDTSSPNLVSRTFEFFRERMKVFDGVNESEYNYNKRIYEYLTLTGNRSVLSLDQDMYTMLGACSLLERANINHMVVDYAGLFNAAIRPQCPVLHYKWSVLKKLYPLNLEEDDSIHFNEDGHEFISAELLKAAKDNNLI